MATMNRKQWNEAAMANAERVRSTHGTAHRIAGILQTMGSAELAAIARGELDMVAMARVQLASRGEIPMGAQRGAQWIGYADAHRIHLAAGGRAFAAAYTYATTEPGVEA